MIIVKEHQNLSNYHTFGLNTEATYFTEVTTKDELIEAIQWAKAKGCSFYCLGGGSNIVFVHNYYGLIIKNNCKGIQLLSEDQQHSSIEVQGGEVWHDWVLYSIGQGWNGLENLSLIPGTVGASPIQNIGAYGVELKDVFHSLTALDINTLEEKTFSKEECQFGYRNSIFKQAAKGQYIILSVTFQLSKTFNPKTSYGAIQRVLEEQKVKELNAKVVSDAVIAIRESKLPNPNHIGNCGSFFKNPVISKESFATFIKQNPEAPSYPAPDGVKIPAGWLIEQCGWKGKDLGGYGVYEHQALVLVNRGGATPQKLIDLKDAIIQSVKTQFNIEIEAEVNLL